MRFPFNPRLVAIGLSVALSAAALPAAAQVMVGGAPMLPSKDIVDNACMQLVQKPQDRKSVV